VEVVVQAMAIALGMAGLFKWVEDDHGVLNKKVLDGSTPSFSGSWGFDVHGINGMAVIPLLVLVLLVVSFFAKVDGGTRLALILLGLIVVQVVLGLALHGVPYVALLHGLNAFAILVVAYRAGKLAGGEAVLPLVPATAATV
jgi:hypothetical protein